MVGPISQWFGRFLGNNGSTSNVGTPALGSIDTIIDDPPPLSPSSMAPPAQATMITATASAAPKRRYCFRFIGFLH